MSLLPLLFVIITTFTANSSGVCWKHAHNRGGMRALNSCPNNTEQSGLLCYPPCKSGYTGIASECWEKSYNHNRTIAYFRGAGVPMVCSDDEEQYGALCYNSCKNNYKPVGTVCWQQCANTEYSINGGAVCCDTEQDCTRKIMQWATELPVAIAKIIMDGLKNDIDAVVADKKELLEAILDFEIGYCPADA